MRLCAPLEQWHEDCGGEYEDGGGARGGDPGGLGVGPAVVLGGEQLLGALGEHEVPAGNEVRHVRCTAWWLHELVLHRADQQAGAARCFDMCTVPQTLLHDSS